MATVVTTDKSWEEPEKTRESGTPPGPGVVVSHTGHGETRKQDIRLATPLYKSGPVPNVPHATGIGSHITRESKIEPSYYQDVPDYRLEREKESYNLKIIDPKVELTNSPPFRYGTLPLGHYKTPDFPSTHSKRSFMKMGTLEPRRAKSSLSTSSITPGDYLTQSLERHRKAYMSPLRENLRINERDVTLPWCAATRPGHMHRAPLEDLTASKLNRSASWQFSPKTVVNVNGGTTKPRPRSPDLLKIRTDFSPKPVVYKKPPPPPAPQPPPPQPTYWPMPVFVPVTYEIKEERKANVEIHGSSHGPCVNDDYGRIGRGTTIVKVKDETTRRPKPKSIMKNRILKEFEEERISDDRRIVKHAEHFDEAPRLKSAVQTTDTIEESKKTEEVERHARSSRGHGTGKRQHRSHSSARGAWMDDELGRNDRTIVDQNGYRQERVTREYCRPDDDYYCKRSGGGHERPIVEFPPTLPRSEESRYGSSNRSMMSSRDYGRSKGNELDHYGQEKMPKNRFDWHLEPQCYMDSWFTNKYGDDVTGLEREFRESSLAPVPFNGQNMDEREYREEKIPNGRETLKREIKVQSGSRGGNNVFNESRQEVHFNREQEFDEGSARRR